MFIAFVDLYSAKSGFYHCWTTALTTDWKLQLRVLLLDYSTDHWPEASATSTTAGLQHWPLAGSFSYEYYCWTTALTTDWKRQLRVLLLDYSTDHWLEASATSTTAGLQHWPLTGSASYEYYCWTTALTTGWKRQLRVLLPDYSTDHWLEALATSTTAGIVIVIATVFSSYCLFTSVD